MPALHNQIQKNLQLVQQRIEVACNELHRDPEEIRLIAVSKTHTADAVRAAYEQGQKWFGENYVDELIEKHVALQGLEIQWSFIGTLQSNKLQKLVRFADEIQTVASLKHAQFIQRYALEFKKIPYPIFICVNLENESQKSGVSFEDIKPLVSEIQKQCPDILIKGLMAIPPAKYSDECCGKKVPDVFKQLLELNQNLGFSEVSLGMTHDMNLALAAGSTTLRIGTAIFGER